MVVVYWLPSVGIGAATPPPPVLPGPQTVEVPLTDILNFKWPDGTPQVNVVNLWGACFTSSSTFEPPFLTFDPILQEVLSNGTYKALQQAGIKVVLSITGAGSFGWSSIPADQVQNFANYLNTVMLDPDMGYGLDGIDIDDEYSITGNTLTQTVATMRNTFAPEKLISKALAGGDTTPDSEIAQYLNYGAIMTYGDSPLNLENWFTAYVSAGFLNGQLLIGVNAGPTEQGAGNFTSVGTTQQVALWQPAGGTKLGMMLWSFSQDIQQFTAYPQNQAALQFPNTNDHAWLNAIVANIQEPNPSH
jgi:hypothetical protein